MLTFTELLNEKIDLNINGVDTQDFFGIMQALKLNPELFKSIDKKPVKNNAKARGINK